MKATVSRQLFMEQIYPIVVSYGACVSIADGVLVVASFRQGIAARIPAYVIRKGQAFFNCDEWQNIIAQIENVGDLYVEIGSKNI